MEHQSMVTVAQTEWNKARERNPAAAPKMSMPMDMTASRALSKDIAQWSETGDLSLYKEAEQKKCYPWEVLEERDPSLTSPEGEILTPLDALGRALYSLGLNLSSMTVEQFAAGPGLILTPALVLRWVRQGVVMAAGSMGVTVSRRVNGLNVHPIFLEAEEVAGDAAKAPPTTTDRKRLGASQGGLPRTHVGYRDKDVKIGTYGRDLTFDYSVLKYMSMQEMRLIFNYIGMQIGYDDIGNIFDIIDVGDGSSGAPPTRLQISGATGGGTLAFADLTTALVRLREGGFSLTHWVGQSDSMIDFLNLSQFTGANDRDQTLAQVFAGRGPIDTPIGKLLITSQGDADHLGFFDGTFAIAKGEESPLTVETDKIIQMQFEETAVVGRWAFWKLAHDASGMVDYS